MINEMNANNVMHGLDIENNKTFDMHKDIKSTKHKREIITSDLIKYYSKYSSIPIPINNPEYLEYYVNILDKYYNAKIELNLLIEDVVKIGSLEKLKKETNKTVRNVVENIKLNAEFKNLSEKKSKLLSDNDLKLCSRGNHYNCQNAGHNFISIDMKTANYNIFRYYCPTIFEGKLWGEYLSKFTDSKYLLNSKFLREVIFSHLGYGQMSQLPIIFLNMVHKTIESTDFLLLLEKIYCWNDELIYKIKDVDNFDYNKLMELINNMHNMKYKDMFHIRYYNLHQIGKYDYYVKEYKINKKPELKCIPRNFIAQCIKHYECLPINRIDMKFTDTNNDLVATYETKLFE